jgi:chitosanase
MTMKQKQLIQRILNTFETGTPAGRYDALVIFPDGLNDSRQITYGRSQTTEQGNLGRLVSLYCSKGGVYGPKLSRYLPKIGIVPLCDDEQFKALLISSAKEDPIMRTSQDEFFDSAYWRPAEDWFTSNGFILPLSMLVIYDSFIHSGRIRDDIRNRFPELPPAKGGDEKAWTTAYVQARHEWLKNHQRKILRKTIYRTQVFMNEISRNNWNLEILPVIANGIKVF